MADVLVSARPPGDRLDELREAARLADRFAGPRETHRAGRRCRASPPLHPEFARPEETSHG